jgi:hypothetical protein
MVDWFKTYLWLLLSSGDSDFCCVPDDYWTLLNTAPLREYLCLFMGFFFLVALSLFVIICKALELDSTTVLNNSGETILSSSPRAWVKVPDP